MKLWCIVVVVVSMHLLFLGDTKELTIRGGHLGPNMWPKAISMIAAGDLPMEDIISDTFPLSDFKKGIDKVSKSYIICKKIHNTCLYSTGHFWKK